VHSLAPSEVARAFKLAEVVGSSFDEADKICDLVQSEENLLDLPETDNRSILRALAEDLDPLRKLWAAAKQHVQNGHDWLKTSLAEVNAEQAERDAGELLAQAQKVSKALVKQGPARAASARVANQMVAEVKELLDSTIPLIQLVCTQELQDRTGTRWRPPRGCSCRTTRAPRCRTCSSAACTTTRPRSKTRACRRKRKRRSLK
jgi:hypothetical protein